MLPRHPPHSPPGDRPFRSVLAAALLLCAGITVLFWRVPVRGEVILPGDIPYTTPLWWGTAPNEAYYRAANYVLSDQVTQFYPWHHLAAESMQAGEGIPLWNPYEFTGQPLVANAQSALFYPPNLLLYWLSPAVVTTVRALLHLLLAGLFTFLLCRDLGIGAAGARLAAVSFAFSGPVIAWLGHPHGSVLVWLPFLLWCAERLLAGARPALWTGLTAAGVALALLGGHPGTAFHVLVVVAAWFGLRLAGAARAGRRLRPAAAFAAALALGALLAAVQVLPFLDLLLHSGTLSRGGRGAGAALSIYSGEWWGHLAGGITLWFPNFFGNPVDRDYAWPFAGGWNYSEGAIHFGLVPLVLAAAALAAGRGEGSRPRRIAALVAGLCLAVAWRLPGFELLNHVPPLSLVANGRLRLPFALLAAVLAGFGLDAVRRALAGKGNARPLWAAAAVAGAGAAAAITLLVLRSALLLAPGEPPATFRAFLLLHVFAPNRPRTMISVVVLLAVAVVALAWCRGRLSTAALGPVAVALTMAELLVTAYGYNPTMPARDVLPPSPVLEALKRDPEPFRILASGDLFLPNYNVVARVAHLGGADVPVPRRYSDVVLAQGAAKDWLHSWGPGWPLAGALNGKYYLTRTPPAEPGWTLLHDGWNVKVYANDRALPRAYVVREAEVVRDPAALLQRILAAPDELATRVLLEEDLPPEEAVQLRGGEPMPASIVRYGNDEVEVAADPDFAGVLVMSDQHADGWQARLDGERVPLYRANYAWRAVFLPPGRHRVSLSYRPASFRAGVATSLAGAAALAGLLLAAAVRRGRQASPADSPRTGGAHHVS